jgi:hypothetical protein
MKKYFFVLSSSMLAFAFFACKKQTEVYRPAISISDYVPLETGKYITYRLDSLVYLNFGTRDTVFSYEAKYVVDSNFTDNLGRSAYRIFRFIRKAAPAPWVPSGTFMAIDDTSGFEFVENNMRFLKMVLPIQNGTSWKGNVFIDTYSLNSEVKYLDDWDYVYDSVGLPATVGNYNLDNTLTVHQRDEISGDPSIDTVYSEVNFSAEKYAKGVGLVYRKFFHSEYQPNTGGGTGYIADGSYGVTLTMIDHN